MDAQLAAVAGLCLCVVARCGGFVTTSTWPCFPGVCLKVRALLSVTLSAVAMPAVLASTSADGAVRLTPLALAAELLLGLAMGTAVACITASASWSFGMMAAACGLPAGDAADPETAEGAGFARLAWWIAAGGFLAAGGNRLVVAGLLDSFRAIPIGGGAGGSPDGGLAAVLMQVPATAFVLAVSLALPVLAALLAYHAVVAIVIRVAAFDPGSGFIQAVAALVLLAILHLSADVWIGGFPRRIERPLEDCFVGTPEGR